MKILENNQDLGVFLDKQRIKGLKIALIPTMGSIHEGHKSLIKKSNELGFFSLVSIFINPTQFNDQEDYNQYPHNKGKDIELLEEINTDLVFFPSIKDLYPNGVKSEKTILDYRDILCDKFRPGHFDGVTTVVKSLFDLVNPEHAFFGQKDYQQLKIIQKIIEKNKLNILIHSCASIRMLNGISYSSRYSKFKPSQEKIFNQSADIILENVLKLKKEIKKSFLENIKKELYEINIKNIDYIEIRDDVNLFPSNTNKNARLFIAYYIDNIRIIDNFILY